MARILQQHPLEMPRPDKGSSSTYYATTKRARQDELRGGEKSALGFDNILRELAKLGHADQTSENHAAANETIIKFIREEDDRGRCLKRHHTAAKSSASDKTSVKRDSGKNEPPQQDPRPPPKVQAESKDLSTTRHTSASLSHAEANLSSPPPPPKFSVTPRTPAGALAQPVAANADVQTHLVDRALSDGTSETATLHPSVATFSSTTILDSADFNSDAEDMDIDRNSPVKSSRWTDLFVEKPLVVMQQFPAFSLPDVPPSSRQWTCDDDLEDPDTLLPPAARLHQRSETNGEIAEQINSPFGVKLETLDFLSSKIDRSTTASHSHSLLSDSEVVDVQTDDSEDIDGEPVAEEPVQDKTENIDDAVRFRLRRPRRFTEQSDDAMLSLVSDEDCAPQFADDARAVIKGRRLKEENNARRDAAKSEISLDDVVCAIDRAIDAHIGAEAGSVLIVANSPTYNDTHNAGNVSPLQQATTNFATEPMLNVDDGEPHFSAQSYVPTVSQIHEANETAEVPVFASAVEKAVDDAEPPRVRCSTYQYLSYPLLKFFRMKLGEMAEKAKRLPLREFYSQFVSNRNISNKFNVQLTVENVERIIKRQCNRVVVIRGGDDAVLFVKPNWYFAVFEWKPSAVLECEIEHDPAVFLKVQERLRTILTRSSVTTVGQLFEKWKKGEIDCNGSIVVKSVNVMCAVLHQYFTDTVEVSSDRSEPLNQTIVSLVRDAQFPSLCIAASSGDGDVGRRFTYLPFEYLRSFRNRIREEIKYRRDMRLREVVKRLHHSKVVQNLGVLTVANVERIIARQCRDVLKLSYDEAGLDEYHAFTMAGGVDQAHQLGSLFVTAVSFTSDPIPRSFMQKYRELDDELRQLFVEKMQVTLYNLLTSAPKQYLDLPSLCSAWNRCNSGGGNLAFVFESPKHMHDVLKYCFSDIVSLYSNSVQQGFRPDIVVALVLDAKFPARILTNNSSDDDADDAGSRRSRSSSRSTEHRSRGRLVEDDDDSYWRRMLTNGGERFRSDLVADLNDVFAEVEEKEDRTTLPLPKLYNLYKNNVTVSRRRRQPFKNAQQMGDIIKIYLADEFSVCFRPANRHRIAVDFVRRITH